MNRFFPRRLAYALLPLLLLSQGPATPQAQTSGSVRQRFLGTWRLVVDENISKDGKITYPDFGPHGIGYLVYAPDGHMCVGLMNPDRPKWTEPRDPSDKEKIALFETFYGYCGKYEIHEAEHVMMHYPELASTPDFVNSTQPRPYTFDGDRLTFMGPNPGPQGGTFRITWEKVR
jgi:hypothetical protein